MSNTLLTNTYDQTGSYTATFMSCLKKQSKDLVLTVLGDSTTDGVGEWPDLLTSYLATSFPAYTVTKRFWNVGTLVYDAPTTVQTGSGSKTLAVYIGGASGSQVTYAYTNVATIVPVTPDLVIMSYGHNNNNPLIFESLYFQATKEILSRYPSAVMLVVAQNPKALGVANYQNALDNAFYLSRLAGVMGYGLVNFMQAFFDYGNYAADLLDPDGIHPNAAGSAFQLNLIIRYFPTNNYSLSRAPKKQLNRLAVTNFTAVEGGATFGINSVFAGNGGVAAWTMPDAVKSGIQSMAIELPNWWQTVQVTVYFQTPTSSVGKNIVLRFVQLPLDTSSATLATGTQGLSAVAQVVAGKAANTPNSCLVRSYSGNTWTPASPRFPFQFSIYRDADNALDTYDGQSVLITGVVFERLT